MHVGVIPLYYYVQTRSLLSWGAAPLTSQNMVLMGAANHSILPPSRLQDVHGCQTGINHICHLSSHGN